MFPKLASDLTACRSLSAKPSSWMVACERYCFDCGFFPARSVGPVAWAAPDSLLATILESLFDGSWDLLPVLGGTASGSKNACKSIKFLLGRSVKLICFRSKS